MNALPKPLVNFVTREEVAGRFKGKRVAIVGSAPSVLKNKGSLIDGHDLVVRVNNYKTRQFAKWTGERTDVHYSFYGHSIKKAERDLWFDGVRLCMCKCPDSKPIESPWHEGERYRGVDFRWIYEKRQSFWFCDTYIPTDEAFLEPFELLGRRMPTTGFSAIYEILQYDCHVYLTGFDFFSSGRHNVNERWRPGQQDDPIRHAPEIERAWLTQYVKKNSDQVRIDATLRRLIA